MYYQSVETPRGIGKDIKILSPNAIELIQILKTKYLRAGIRDCIRKRFLIALSTTSSINPVAAQALRQLPKIKGCPVHTTARLSAIDRRTIIRLEN